MSGFDEFAKRIRELESAYLSSSDPMEQSGFSGGRERWIAERSPLVDALDNDGDFLDVGCANGLLVSDVADWAGERGLTVEPHGVDLGARLIDLARERHPDHRGNFSVADAWGWRPRRRWTYVYSILDLSPPGLWCDWLRRLLSWVEPSGKLIIGSYGSRTRRIEPTDVEAVMSRCGLSVEGSSQGGDPPLTRFAWSAGASPG